MPMNVSSSKPSDKANIFRGLIECELNSLLSASHLVDYISVHIRFDLERYLLNSWTAAFLKDRFPVGGMFRAERNFLLFEDQLADSKLQRTKEIIVPRRKFHRVENSP